MTFFSTIILSSNKIFRYTSDKIYRYDGYTDIGIYLMGTIYSITNQKGGVGKTTTNCVSLGSALAGKPILFFAKESEGAMAYRELAEEVLKNEEKTNN